MPNGEEGKENTQRWKKYMEEEEEEKKKITTLRFIYGRVRLTLTLIFFFFSSRTIFPVPDLYSVYPFVWSREIRVLMHVRPRAHNNQIQFCVCTLQARFSLFDFLLALIFGWVLFIFFFLLIFHLILQTFMLWLRPRLPLLHMFVCIDRRGKKIIELNRISKDCSSNSNNSHNGKKKSKK